MASYRQVGIDYEKKRCVFIGSSECDMEDPANDSEFLKKRRECAVRAEMEARRALVKARGEVVNAKDSAHVVGVGEAAGISIASYREILAKETLSGVLVLTTDEWQEVPALWDAVRYSVDEDGSSGRYLLTGSATPNTRTESRQIPERNCAKYPSG